MLPIGKTRRKLRPFFRCLFACIFVFLLTCVAAILIIFFKLTHVSIRSPLGKSIDRLSKPTTQQQITQDLTDKNITFEKLTITDSTITILLPNNLLVYLTTQKDIASQIASLQLTMLDLTIEKKTPSKIDFRFDRPVISF